MYLTVKETAELIRVSERHAYRLIKQNVIPHTKIGGKILINKERLLNTLEKEEVK
ncbi:helix-turn-helix domain-containing protein [Staphylococcus epidermidis]|nr:helix-turn-helix domain-containing protein [Staphylococcus epidermidis]MCG1173239.1 helix-turn-helix domain-containing protein [Staphylococcus epidermidis]